MPKAAWRSLSRPGVEQREQRMQGRKRERISIGDFYDRQVLPALFDHLDQAFPEFGWKRTNRGWTATNREHTKSLCGARPGRVVCNQPFGFLIHGGTATSWPAYVNGGTTPTGIDFVEAVRKLADLAGVDASILDKPLSPEAQEACEKRQKDASLLETFLAHAKEMLLNETAGAKVRTYLTDKRGFKAEDLEDLPLGLCPDFVAVKAHLEAAGFSQEEIKISGLLVDGRWPGRLLIPWSDPWGRIATIVARDLTGTAEEGAKYLYLKGRTKPTAFGLDVALRTKQGRQDLILFEGFLDVIALQTRGFSNAAALGGTGSLLTKDRWQALADLRVRQITLAMDNDQAGKDGLLKALDNLRNVPDSPVVYVVDPAALGECKDPDELIQTKGLEAWQKVLEGRLAGPVYRGKVLLEGITPASPDQARREAVEKVLDYDAGLRGSRVSLDREDLLKLTAERTGYTYEALADMADDHARRRRKIETEQEARHLLDQAQREAHDSGPLIAVERLRDRLGTFAGLTEEPPPAFSVDRLDEATRKIPKGKSSGWAQLDKLEVYFNPGELAIVGARTGHGKTSFLLNLLWNWLNASTDPDEILIIYSAEEAEVRLYHRLLVLASTLIDENGKGWSVNEVRDFLREGPLARGQNYGWPGCNLDAEKEQLRDLEDRLMIVYRPSWSCTEIAAHVRELAQHRNIGGVFVDYLQRLPPPGSFDRRDIEISAAGRAFKHLAVDAGCPVIAAAQINREGIPDKFGKRLSEAKDFAAAMKVIRSARPQLHNLREGGSEQEADLVLGLLNYAADYQQREAEKGNDFIPGTATLPSMPFEVGALKNRYGPVGQWADLRFLGRQGLLQDT